MEEKNTNINVEQELARIEQEKKHALNPLNSAEKKQDFTSVVVEQVKKTDNVKDALDLFATATAMENQENVDKVVGEKAEELRNDAEAKRIVAEKNRIEEETKKAVAEKEKVIAEYDKVIAEKQKEVEQLKADSDKADAYFKSNKDILKYIGIREKKSLGTMQTLMFPATIVFIIVQFLLFPLNLCGLILETIVNIIGGICGAITNNALKIILSILIVVLVVGGGFCAYFFGGRAISNL